MLLAIACLALAYPTTVLLDSVGMSSMMSMCIGLAMAIIGITAILAKGF